MTNTGSGQGSQPYEATAFMPLFPERTGAWKLAASYPLLRPVAVGVGSAAASAHYRNGQHVVVVTLTDVQVTSAVFGGDPSLAGTRELPDGIIIVEKLHGRWVQERAYHPPYTDHVVGGFSYNMLLDPQALPLSDDCAVLLTIILGNGVLVTMRGPPDTNLAMLKEVLAGIDLDRCERLARGNGTSGWRQPVPCLEKPVFSR